MHILFTPSDCDILHKDCTTLGFVPTMGNLHVGHVSLIERSQVENDKTVVSIFINPTQFNNPDDFLKYPKTLKADLKILEDLKVDYCFIPSNDIMYADNYQYRIQENTLSQNMEGVKRPGHFEGVLTIVLKLLQIIRPTRVYFGEKDFQQYQLIDGMVKAFFIPTKVLVCPTIREASGLAYSSRNNRLSPAQKEKAVRFAMIFHCLKSIPEMQKLLEAEEIQVDYITEHEGRRFIAVYIDDLRLIDHKLLFFEQ